MENGVQAVRAEILAPGDGPRVYTKAQMMELLGIKNTTYSKLIKVDESGHALLRTSRLMPGGPRVHTQQQYDDYLAYLNSAGVVGAKTAKSEIADWKSRKASGG